MSHWAEQYIGKPWVSGARGPFMFDCWGLAHWIYKHHYGITLPEFVNEDSNDFMAVCRKMNAEERKHQLGQWAEWRRTDAPFEGCAVLMGGQEMFCHVGVYITPQEGPFVLHCYKEGGVVAESPHSALFRSRLQRINFYQNARIYPHSKSV